MKFKTAVRQAQFFRSRWLLPPPRPLPADFGASEPSRAPLLMISQVQRSGGSMFVQLLDNHPELEVFPGEIHIAKPKNDWPRLRPKEHPSITFRRLVDHRCIEYAKIGFKKSVLGTERLDFDYDVDLHHSLFCTLCRQYKPATQRELLDLFFTSFFAIWRRNSGAHFKDGGKLRYFSGFAAGFAANEDAVTRYFRDYPDGHLVSIIRRPKNWLPSALKKETSRSKFEHVSAALSVWQRSAEAMYRNVNRFPGKVSIIEFESLIADTRHVMERFAERLGLGFDPILVTPTFQGVPVESNSSFHTVKGFVDSSVLSREAEDSVEMGRCLEIYDKVSAMSLCRNAAGCG